VKLTRTGQICHLDFNSRLNAKLWQARHFYIQNSAYVGHSVCVSRFCVVLMRLNKSIEIILHKFQHSATQQL